MLNYPVILVQDIPDGDYGVVFPDLPGCVSQGSTMDEALAMGKEAAEGHLESLLEVGGIIPEPATIDRHRADPEYARPEYAGGIWAIVSVDDAKLPQKALRINISVPERVLGVIDRFAEDEGETRSGLLMKATAEYIARHGGSSSLAAAKGKNAEDQISKQQTMKDAKRGAARPRPSAAKRRGNERRN